MNALRLIVILYAALVLARGGATPAPRHAEPLPLADLAFVDGAHARHDADLAPTSPPESSARLAALPASPVVLLDLAAEPQGVAAEPALIDGVAPSLPYPFGSTVSGVSPPFA